tara:strand:- start:289 stop:1308 length:1020 start_codon:yes stop_codon:yes gene_type:complete
MFAKKKNKNIIVIFFIVSFWSCNQTESSTNFKDIDVYTSFENEIHIKDILDGHLFDFKYFTPSPQNKYTTQIKNTNLFLEENNNSVIMLVTTEEPYDSISLKIANRLTESSINNVTLINDYYTKDQLLFVIKAKEMEDLPIILDINKEWILYKIKENEFLKFKNQNFNGKLNDSLIHNINLNFGLNMDIQEDYHLIKQSIDEKYIWLGRAYPYRWIFLYEDIQQYYNTNKSSYQRLNQKFEDILDINALPYNTQFDNIKIDNDEARKIYGVYGTKVDAENITGGPFIAYLFDIPKTNKVLIASGFVNFPGKNKVYHLKELEYIIENSYGINKNEGNENE